MMKDGGGGGGGDGVGTSWRPRQQSARELDFRTFRVLDRTDLVPLAQEMRRVMK